MCKKKNKTKKYTSVYIKKTPEKEKLVEEAKQDSISVDGKPWNLHKPTVCTQVSMTTMPLLWQVTAFCHLSALGEKFD